jgi:hypothetical protein
MNSRLRYGACDVVDRLETVQAVRSIRLVQQRRALDGKATAWSHALQLLEQDDLLVRGHETAWSEARARLRAVAGTLRALRSLEEERLFLGELRGELLRRHQRLQEEQQRLEADREDLAKRGAGLALRERLLDERRVQGASNRASEVERRNEDELVHRRREV